MSQMRNATGSSYAQQRSARALKATITDDFGNERSLKRCKKCFSWKERELDFYTYPSYGQCKTCIGKRQQKYRSDPEVRARRLEYQKTLYREHMTDPYLKARKREDERRWREANKDSPEFKAKRAEYDRRRMERIYADPEKHRDFLEKKRIEGRLRREKQGVPSVPNRGKHHIKYPVKNQEVWLPVGPIRGWLNEYAASQGFGSIKRLANASDVTEKMIYRIRNEMETVELGVVEKLLAHTDTLIEDLYPSLDEELAA